MSDTDPHSSPDPPPNRIWLRRTDQVCAAVIAVASLLAIAISWLQQGGHRGRLIEIDRAEKKTANFQVNINEASWAELSLLPGIGEVKAKSIVSLREAQGSFQSIEELRRVKGIGPRTLEKMRPYLLPLDQSEQLADSQIIPEGDT